MPFIIVGDEAFALTHQISKPYPRRNLTIKQRVYSYRLTRARRMAECTFGILANKWRIFHHPIDVGIGFSDEIIKACCVLHNFVRKHDGIIFHDESYECPLPVIQPVGTRANTAGTHIRDYFANYFTSPQGSVAWQYDKI